VVGVAIVAGVTAHARNGFFIFRPGEGYEYVLVLGVAAAALGTLGPGMISVDNAIGLDSANTWWAFAVSFGLGTIGAAALLATCWRPNRKDPA